MSKRNIRAAHWKDIASKVRTHEGELLTGKKGRDYQRKYSKEYLGRDLSISRVKINEDLVARFEKKR